jgi:hypothetical protein
VDTEHKFNPGDRVTFTDLLKGQVFDSAVIEHFHGNTIYTVKTQDGKTRWAYEFELYAK